MIHRYQQKLTLFLSENQCWYAYQKLIEMSTHVDRKLGDPAAFVEVGKLVSFPQSAVYY